MDVSKYIAEFLISKGQVKLPGLGSFISTYQSAHFQEGSKVLLPPSRIYSFDPLKDEADNTLALFIAGKENAPVSIAEKEVEEYVEECHYVINKGKRLEITGVGLLFKNESGNIQFDQEANLVTEGDFYGLPEITVKASGRVSKSSYKTAKIIMIVFFFMGLVIAGFYAGMVNKQLLNKFFPTSTPTDSTLLKPDSQNIAKKDSTITPAIQTTTDTVKKVEPAPGKETVTAVPEPVGEQFYIVAGCFRSEEGAVKTVKQLKEKGFDSKIFGKSDKGLNMVCYASFSDKAEAKKYLTKILAETDSKAWLIKY